MIDKGLGVSQQASCPVAGSRGFRRLWPRKHCLRICKFADECLPFERQTKPFLFSLPQDFIAVLGVPTEQLVYTPAIFGSSALNMLKALRNAVPFCCLELHFTNGIHFDIYTDFQQYLAGRTEIQRRNTSSIYRMHKPSKCFRQDTTHSMFLLIFQYPAPRNPHRGY